jgi:hypothetical protein
MLPPVHPESSSNGNSGSGNGRDVDSRVPGAYPVKEKRDRDARETLSSLSSSSSGFHAVKEDEERRKDAARLHIKEALKGVVGLARMGGLRGREVSELLNELVRDG